MESSEFESVFQQNPSMEQKLHDGKYFCIEKVKYKHRWEIRKSIQENQKLNPVCIESLKREFEIGSQLQHPFICSYYQFSSNEYFINREYIDGLAWNDYFDAHKEEISNYKNYAIQLLEAIQYMHSKGIFHMDLKQENVLISHELKTIKLIDFGHAVYRNDELWRGGAKVTSNPDKLISAEQDWNAFFSLLQSMKSQLPRNLNSKLEKANKLYLTNGYKIDFYAVKSILKEKSKIGIKQKLVFLFGLMTIVTLLIWKKNDANNSENKLNLTKTEVNSSSKKDELKPIPEKEMLIENQNKVEVQPKYALLKPKEHRVISEEDSIFFVNKAELFGSDIENRFNIIDNSKQKHQLLKDLIDNYILKFVEYAELRHLDSIQSLKAKNIYEYRLSKLFYKYFQLLQ